MPATPGEVEVKGLFGPKIVVRADNIEITRNGQMQTFPKSLVKGYRSYAGRGVTYFTLELLNEPKPVKFNIGSSRAPQVRAALAGVADLDGVDLRAAEEAIRNDPAYGGSPEERWQTLQSEKRLALIINVAGGVIAAWAVIFPNPYAISVIACAAIAPVALALTYAKQARWYLAPRKNDPHPSVMIAMLASAIGVGLRALIDVDFLDWMQVWLIAAAAGFALTAAVLALFNQLSAKSWFGVFIGIAYAFGIAAQSDSILDNAPSQIFQTRVVDMHVSHGRSTSYSATLAPWGPETNDNNHSISRGLYDQLQPGGDACVTLHPGALHLRWYVISACGSNSYDGNVSGKGTFGFESHWWVLSKDC